MFLTSFLLCGSTELKGIDLFFSSVIGFLHLPVLQINNFQMQTSVFCSESLHTPSFVQPNPQAFKVILSFSHKIACSHRGFTTNRM